MDHLRWEALHEGLDLESQVATYYERTGYYPESLLGDMIYGMRENRRYFSRLGIKFAGKPLGRPGKVTETNREELKQLKALRREEYCSTFRLKGNSVEVRTGIGSIISGQSGRHIQCLSQQHLPGDESDHSAEGLFCPLGKGALSAPGTVPDYRLGIDQISIIRRVLQNVWHSSS